MWNCTISEYSFQNLNEIIWRKSENFGNEGQLSSKFFTISEDDFMKILKRVRGWVQFLINNTSGQNYAIVWRLKWSVREGLIVYWRQFNKITSRHLFQTSPCFGNTLGELEKLRHTRVLHWRGALGYVLVLNHVYFLTITKDINKSFYFCVKLHRKGKKEVTSENLLPTNHN